MATTTFITVLLSPFLVSFEHEAVQELFRKRIGDRETVVVVREAVALGGRVGERLARQHGSTSVIRVELHAEDGARPVVLAPITQTDFPDFRGGFSVEAIFVAGMEGEAWPMPELVVVCLLGDMIALWRIKLSRRDRGPDGWVLINPRDPRLAVRQPIQAGEFQVTMSRTDGWWQCDIHPRHGEPIRYEQEKDSSTWRFKRVGCSP